MPRPREKGPWFWRSAIGVMVVSVFGLFAVAAFNRAPPTDPVTACRLDLDDPAHTIILIDQSDPFNPNDFGWVSQFLDTEARALPKYGRLSIVTPKSSDPYNPNIVFSACTPGSVEDANPIFQNPRMIDDTWRDTFFAPLSDTVEVALVDTRQPSSPLAETLFAIADRADFQDESNGRRIVIVSDLMQHSDTFSFYRQGADFDAFNGSKLGEELPALEEVEVVARIVPRQEYDLPISEIRGFWRDYFERSLASYGSVN